MTFQWEPAPIVGGAYSDSTRPWSVQDTVNWIPVAIEREGGRSDAMLRSAPGASVFSVPGASAPVRGLHNVEGKLFAVIGSSLYQMTPTGVAIPRGNIPGVARVSMTHNQISGGNELVIGNGQSGYVYNTKTESLAQITDPGFPGFKVCDYVDSYIVGVEPAGRFWFHSDLAAATEYNTLDRAEDESQPDRIVGLVVSHREVFVLGERSGGFYRNSGASTGTFQRADGTEMEVGCASAHSVCKLDNSVFWLGNDGSVYRLNGYQPARVSTRPLEQAIAGCNMAEAFAFTFEDRGHKIYYLTFPDGMTWGYDVASGEWHRRQSVGMHRWRVNCMVRWNKQWIAGDYVNGKLYRVDWDMPWENGEVIERRRVSGVMHGNQNRVSLDAVELVFDTGADDLGPGDLHPPQPVGPSITGNAPDGEIGAPYTFTYTVTAGDAPVIKTTITNDLPPGLAWDERTATLSGTVAYEVIVRLDMRTVDSNGLWAEHSDNLVFSEVYDILVVGDEASPGQPMWASGKAEEQPVFAALTLTSGANLARGLAAYYGGIFSVVNVKSGGSGGRYGTPAGGWTASTADNVTSAAPLTHAGGPAGWLVTTTTGALLKAPPTPTAYTVVDTTTIRPEWSAVATVHYIEPNYYLTSAGTMLKSTDLVTWDDVYIRDGNSTIIGFRGLVKNGDDLYGIIRWNTFDERIQIRKSSDGGVTWGGALLSVPPAEINFPAEIASNGQSVVAISNGGVSWSSADNFATTHATGVENHGKVLAAAGRFYLFGENGPQPVCVVSDDGMSWGEPINLPSIIDSYWAAAGKRGAP